MKRVNFKIAINPNCFDVENKDTFKCFDVEIIRDRFNGYLFEIPALPERKFVVHESQFGGWIASDYKTGCHLAVSETMQGAIKEGIERINSLIEKWGIKKVYRKIYSHPIINKGK